MAEGTSRRAFLACAAASLAWGCSPGDSANTRGFVTWGSQGFRDGDFLQPRAIACRDGRVYVIDTTGRVQVFDEEGAFIDLWKTPDAANGTPTAIAFGLDGRLLIPDTHYHQILEYSTQGELLEQWGAYGNGPEQFIYPTGIEQAADGRYFISEYGDGAERVHVFDGERNFVTQWGGHGPEPGYFNRAMAVAIDGDVVHVADTTNHRIETFSLDGELIRITGSAGDAVGELKFPYDIALAPDRTLLAAEYGNNRISRFSPEGKCVGVYGLPGRKAGQFNAPRGVAVSESGKVFVADTDNHRVQGLPLEMVS